jgi:hypothetical protein
MYEKMAAKSDRFQDVFVPIFLQKPHDLSNIVDTEDGSFLIMSQAVPSKSDDSTSHLIFTTSVPTTTVTGIQVTHLGSHETDYLI